MGHIINFDAFQAPKSNDDQQERVVPTPAKPELEEQVEDDTAPKTSSYVADKVAKLKAEGYEDDQAMVIATNMAKKRGIDINQSEAAVDDFEEDEADQEIKKVNEKKPNPHMKKHLKDRGELDENVEMSDEEIDRPLDAPYITDMLKGYADDLMSDDAEVAMELRQVARSMKGQYPNNRDISLFDAYEIADDQGIEDDEILQKVKDEIKYIWQQA